MSWKADNTEQENEKVDWLEVIARQLILLNARFEEAFETGIEEEDVE